MLNSETNYEHIVPAVTARCIRALTLLTPSAHAEQMCKYVCIHTVVNIASYVQLNEASSSYRRRLSLRSRSSPTYHVVLSKIMAYVSI